MRNFFFVTILLVVACSLSAQVMEKKLISPYDSSKTERSMLGAFIGEQWKSVWQIPIEVPVIDEKLISSGELAAKYKSPVYPGEKLTAEFLPFFTPINQENEENYQEFVSELATDPLSTRFPYSISIMEKILNAAGFIFPESYPIAIRNNDSTETMGYILISPEIDSKVLTTEELVMLKSTTAIDSIDERSYLKLRLIDILVNNWEKNPLVSRWINKDGIWKPLPGYYKRAFSRFEGILPGVFTSIAPQWNSFEKEYPGIEGLTWNRRQIDRRLLSGMNKPEWESVVNELLLKLNTTTLLEAVDYLPEIFRYNIGINLFEIMLARKNELADIADDYYYYINKSPEIYGTGGIDTLVIAKKDSSTFVSLHTQNYKIEKYYDVEATDEIRIFLGGGNDIVKFECEEKNDMTIRVMGEDGEDSYSDDCQKPENLSFFSFLCPTSTSNYLYDDEDNSLLNLAGHSKFYDKSPARPDLKMEMLFPSNRSRGSGFGFSPILAYSRDDGIIFGLEPMFTTYAFAKSPFDYRLKATTSYSTRSGGYVLGLAGFFNSIVDDATVTLDVRKSELQISKYYGYGNDRSYSEARHDNGGYDLAHEEFYTSADIMFNLSKFVSFSIGGSYNYSDSKPDSADLLSTFPSANLGTGSFKYHTLFTNLTVDTRDNDFYPRKGIFTNLYIGYFPRLMDNRTAFWKSEFVADYYFTYNLFTEMTTHITAGGGKIWNDYPFFKSIVIGGEKTLPGFRDYRFAGDASAYSILSQNIVLSTIRFLVKGKLGLKLIATTGRVFSRADLSDKWHYAFGTGMWFNGFNETIYGEMSAAISEETISVYLNTAFKF